MLPIYVGVMIINHFKDAHSTTSIMERKSFEFFFVFFRGSCVRMLFRYTKKSKILLMTEILHRLECIKPCK